MDVVGGLLQSVGNTIAGLMDGVLRALGAAAREALYALQSVLTVAWLPVIAVALIALLAWNVARR